MDETNLTKGELWRKRIQDFYKSGLSRKEWCIGAWNIKFHCQLWAIGSESRRRNHLNRIRLWSQSLPNCHLNRKLFPGSSREARLWPYLFRETSGSRSVPSVRVNWWLPWSKSLCLIWRRDNRISGMWEHEPAQELQWPGRNHQTKIPPGSLFPLHVCLLQPQTYIDQDPPMGRIRLLDLDETARPQFLSLAGYSGWVEKSNFKGNPLVMWRAVSWPKRGFRGTPPKDHGINEIFLLSICKKLKIR